MQVVASTNYTISSEVDASRIFYYDEDYSFISSATYSAETQVITTPATCKYVRYHIVGTSFPSTFQLEQGSTASTYEAYVNPTMWILNDNDVYEFFMEKTKNLNLFSVTGLGDSTLTQSVTYGRVIIPFTTLSTSGNLTLSNGGVKIGKGISKIKVEGQYIGYGPVCTDIFVGYLKNDDTRGIKGRLSNTIAGYINNTPLYTDIIDVVEGDIIYMFFGVAATGAYKIFAGTSLQIQVIQ